jgi:threonine aldolase
MEFKQVNFCSDNVTGVAPEIMAALVAANHGAAMPYGKDDCTQRLDAQFSELFETDVVVFPVATGSAANALALSVMTPPYGAIYCHAQSHINLKECGAPEFYTSGAKLVALPGADGKIGATDLAAALNGAGIEEVDRVQPAAVSLSQVNEVGAVYSTDEISKVASVTHERGLHLHMDGARLANAAVSLGCTPAEMTWKAGVDVLSFGATKNGAMAAEAVVFFNRDLAQTFGYRRKRSGHLFSKMRFLSVQLEAFITDDLWLRNAAIANQMALKLAQGLTVLPGAKLCYPTQANEIFIELPDRVIKGLLAEGFQFYQWKRENSTIIRLVTAFNTKDEDVTSLIDAARRYI